MNEKLKKANKPLQKHGNVLKELAKNKYLYLLMLPAIIHLAMIEYRSMYGILLAFKEYNAKAGIMGSEWIGLKHFKDMFSDPYFRYVLWNLHKFW